MPTISDVARQAGVSPSTVSRVIQGAPNVRPATRERVQRAIEELGYVPSAVAQSLRSKRTRSLALVVSDITNTFWTTIARGVEDEAQTQGYSVLLCNTDENLAKQHRYLDLLIRQQVDGVIIAPYDSDAEHLEKLRQRRIPTVLVDRRIEGWDVDSVYGDSISGARALVHHLIGLGHTRIAVVSGPANTSTAEDRIAGYCLALTEAGLPCDPRLIVRGEFRSNMGQALTHSILDKGLAPSAIFATNNAIAMGVIDALGARGLRIPQDIALVSFDDLPNLSHLFPFLTVVTQPAYDMGVNAAQLLLSRLNSEVELRPRQVVLPTRLVIRHSCGNELSGQGECPLSLPISTRALRPSILVRALSAEERQHLKVEPAGALSTFAQADEPVSDYAKSDASRLLAVLRHQEADRVPHIEFEISSRPVYEYVLEHELGHYPNDAGIGSQPVTPEEQVEFALRLGMDAVPCNFAWYPRSSDLRDLDSPPSIADQLSYLERYLRAAQGTNVGVIGCFSSFFDAAMAATGLTSAPHRLQRTLGHLEQLMDLLVEHQGKVMRVVCDRFGSDLALIMVRDNVAHHAGLLIPTELFMRIYQPRMARFLAPAKEHDKLLLVHTGGRVNHVLPILHEVGFDGVHPLDPRFNDIFELREKWKNKMALIGNIPVALLARGDEQRIEQRVKEYCAKLAPGGGYVLSSSGPITKEIPPANLVAMTRAVHKYGRFGQLGRAA